MVNMALVGSRASEKLFTNCTTLSLCMTIDHRWKRCLLLYRPFVALESRLPISCMVSMAWSFHVSEVLIAIDANMCVEVMAVYFVRLSCTALFAAAPTRIDVSLRCNSVQISGISFLSTWTIVWLPSALSQTEANSNSYYFVTQPRSKWC